MINVFAIFHGYNEVSRVTGWHIITPSVARYQTRISVCFTVFAFLSVRLISYKSQRVKFLKFLKLLKSQKFLKILTSKHYGKCEKVSRVYPVINVINVINVSNLTFLEYAEYHLRSVAGHNVASLALNLNLNTANLNNLNTAKASNDASNVASNVVNHAEVVIGLLSKLSKLLLLLSVSKVSNIRPSIVDLKAANVVNVVNVTNVVEAAKSLNPNQSPNLRNPQRATQLAIGLIYYNHNVLYKPTGWLLRCGDVAPIPGPDGLGDAGAAAQGVRTGTNANGSCKAELQVMSQNLRGLGDSKKVRHLINKCCKLSREAKDSIFLFQETYVAKLDIVTYIWRGESQVTAGLGNSLGCITLLTAPSKF